MPSLSATYWPRASCACVAPTCITQTGWRSKAVSLNAQVPIWSSVSIHGLGQEETRDTISQLRPRAKGGRVPPEREIPSATDYFATSEP